MNCYIHYVLYGIYKKGEEGENLQKLNFQLFVILLTVYKVTGEGEDSDAGNKMENK